MNKTQILVPGPGTYESSRGSHIVKTAAPKYGFGTSQRAASSMAGKSRNVSLHSQHSEGSPGPGQYELRSIIGNEGPKSSLSYRFKSDAEMRESL